ncbi:DEAD/DEAH box helicase [Nocardioides sp. BP30]|uniref:DEAD/DEAH box helicase n=1 Tax=Nocardioides sp. BP30 TaxID=3036374 RepID=UPI0024684346|nr:DEAD/DEAH box helicase [Nocardioides sp. BP30]WGL52143.1 DEAD/DEAH box helicase [Nocardioides sp. BP30]
MDGSKPVLHMRMSDDGRSIEFTRTAIPDTEWSSIGAMVAETLPRPGQPLIVTAEQLVARAHLLRQTLGRLHGRLDLAPEVESLLRRLRSDQQVVNALFTGEEPTRLLPGGASYAHRLTRVLRDFQEADVDRLWQMRNGANFSVPGAGKTTVTLALHLRERAAGTVERLLVVGPISAFEAWEEESAGIVEPGLTTTRWTGRLESDADVVIVNYQRLRSALPDLISWLSQRRVHLVVDEAHRAKRGALGEWGRALLALAPLAARRDILTGTPAPNHPRDLIALLDILWPGGMATKSAPRAALVTEPTTDAMQSMNAFIRPLYVRTTKEDLDLPPVVYPPVQPVSMGPLQQDIYDAMLKRYAGMLDLGQGGEEMFARMGEVSMYLIQAASSPQLLAASADPARAYRFPPLAIPPGSELARMVETYAEYEVPSKVLEACKIVYRNAQSTPSRKTLVWSNFPGNLLALEQQLAALQPAVVYGGIPSAEDAEPGVRTRERELARFREDPKCQVLLANPAAMAEGVSLHHVCHDAVYLDRTFNAGQYLQSLDRIHRLGLDPETETRIYLLSSAGTIDERIASRLRGKVQRLGQMLDDPGLVALSLPDDEDFGPFLDDDLDIAEVLNHLAGAR